MFNPLYTATDLSLPTVKTGTLHAQIFPGLTGTVCHIANVTMQLCATVTCIGMHNALISCQPTLCMKSNGASFYQSWADV